ncbi:MAG: hypothetical protein VX201_10300, partial [Pseudomonadota bacterium]|nr:hypothetical protein [Pseudomonadota bacterium]
AGVAAELDLRVFGRVDLAADLRVVLAAVLRVAVLRVVLLVFVLVRVMRCLCADFYRFIVAHLFTNHRKKPEKPPDLPGN